MSVTSPAPTPEPEPGAAAADADDSGDSQGDVDSAEYRAARSQREQIRAQREQLEFDRLRGSLLDRAEGERLGFTFFRHVRDRLQNIPARTAAQLAAEGDAHKVEAALTAAIDEALCAAAAALESGQYLREEADDDE